MRIYIESIGLFAQKRLHLNTLTMAVTITQAANLLRKAGKTKQLHILWH